MMTALETGAIDMMVVGSRYANPDLKLIEELHKHLLSKMTLVRTKEEIIEPVRGSILDVNGNVLADVLSCAQFNVLQHPFRC